LTNELELRVTIPPSIDVAALFYTFRNQETHLFFGSVIAKE